MARHYTNKDFFRQMPNAMLTRYFQGRELFGDLDFSAMKEGKPDELFAAWLTLTEAQHSTAQRDGCRISRHLRDELRERLPGNY